MAANVRPSSSDCRAMNACNSIFNTLAVVSISCWTSGLEALSGLSRTAALVKAGIASFMSSGRLATSSALKKDKPVRFFPGVPVGNSRSDILVVQPAQDRQSQRLTNSLDGARDRGVLLQ